MAEIVAVANRKGGVGKTTTSLNLAQCLHDAGKRVLLVDLDEQHNSSTQYHADASHGVTTAYDILTSRAVDPHDAIQSHDDYGDIIPGDDLVVLAAERMASLDCREFMLADALEKISGEYDYIVVDCPPTLGIVTKNVLVAADEVIVPVLCDGFSVDSFADLMEQVAVIKGDRRLNPGLGAVRVLITQYEDRTLIAQAYRDQFPEIARRQGAGMFDTKIRRCVKVKEAQQRCVPLFEYAPACTTAEDYRSLAREFLGAERG